MQIFLAKTSVKKMPLVTMATRLWNRILMALKKLKCGQSSELGKSTAEGRLEKKGRVLTEVN